jgi:protein-disulfide isomerase
MEDCAPLHKVDGAPLRQQAAHVSLSRMHPAARENAYLCAVVVAAALVTGCATRPIVAAAPPADVTTEAADVRILGSSAAPVMIIEFTDLQCPYCARFANTTWPRIRQDYVETGKVRYATRDLPLPFHAFALPAAIAVRCAGQQGKFWEFREALFRDQAQLATGTYAGLVQSLGLDAAQFADCRRDPAVERLVQADVELAAASGIRATPSFVIGRIVDGAFSGEILSGAQPFETFQARISLLLQQAGQ